MYWRPVCNKVQLTPTLYPSTWVTETTLIIVIQNCCRANNGSRLVQMSYPIFRRGDKSRFFGAFLLVRVELHEGIVKLGYNPDCLILSPVGHNASLELNRIKIYICQQQSRCGIQFRTIGQSRVTLHLCFKMSLCAKPFIWKWVWFAWKWTCRGNTFTYEWFYTKTRFDTEAKGNSQMTCWTTPPIFAINMLLGIRMYFGLFNWKKLTGLLAAWCSWVSVCTSVFI